LAGSLAVPDGSRELMVAEAVDANGRVESVGRALLPDTVPEGDGKEERLEPEADG
jgi:hypothetical protein